jgi:hypothetical protein
LIEWYSSSSFLENIKGPCRIIKRKKQGNCKFLLSANLFSYAYGIFF